MDTYLPDGWRWANFFELWLIRKGKYRGRVLNVPIQNKSATVIKKTAVEK